MTEPLKDGAKRLAQPWIAKGYRAAGLHVYRDSEGKELFAKFRLEHPDGDTAPDGRKIIRPIHSNGDGQCRFGEPKFPGKKPLYQLHRVAAKPDAIVWVVEGEKDADALIRLGALATTSGSASSDDVADWAPLAGRKCYLWPDCDNEGRAYMGRVAERLLGLGAAVEAIEVEKLKLPAKGGAADWVQTIENAGYDDLERLPRVKAQATEPEHSQGKDASDATQGPQVLLICGESIKPEPVTWLWRDYLAAGKLHIVAGAPSTGKTTLSVAIAATLTVGGRWPDGTGAPVGDVLIWSGEDSAADTLVPRFMATGADMSKVHFVGDVFQGANALPFDPAKHFPALALAASRLPNLKLMIVDPVVSAVAGDSHQNAEVRRGLQPLVAFAEAQGCALIGISHFTKGTQNRDPLERVTGSLGFGAVARIVLGTAKLKDEDGGGRVLVRVKSNLGPDGGGFKYDIAQVPLPGEYSAISSSRIEWAGTMAGTAREILASAEAEPTGEDQPERAEAADWLFARIKDAGWELDRRDIVRDLANAGFSERTIERARNKAGVVVRQSGFGVAKRSIWSIPPQSRQSRQGQNLGAHGAIGDGNAGGHTNAHAEVPF